MESSIGAKRIHEYMMIPVNFSLMRAVRDGGGQMFALFHMRDAIFTPDGVARWKKEESGGKEAASRRGTKEERGRRRKKVEAIRLRHRGGVKPDQSQSKPVKPGQGQSNCQTESSPDRPSQTES
jgi:hypothetical protein